MRSQAQDHFWPICEKEKVKVPTLGKSSVDVDGGGKKFANVSSANQITLIVTLYAS